MAPVCASFGFRSKVQSTEATWVKLDFRWSYSRWVLWKTKFTFAAKSSFAGWVASVQEDALVGHGFPVMRERSRGCRWDQPVLPLGHKSCWVSSGKVHSGFSQSSWRSPKWHKDKANEGGRSLVPQQQPSCPITFVSWLGFCHGEEIQASIYGSSWKQMRQQKDIEDCVFWAHSAMMCLSSLL